MKPHVALRTRSAQIAAVAVLALGLGACGAGGTATTQSDSDTSGEITVLVESGGLDVLTPIADKYQEETGNTVTFVELPYDSLYDRVNTELSSGSVSFDVAALDAIWMSAFGPGLESLDDMFTDDVTANLFPSLLQEAQVDGSFVGMPAWTNAEILYYRTDLFEDPEQQAAFETEYGRPLEVPTTWEDFQEVSEFFTQDTDGDGTVDLYGSDVKGAVETEWLAMVLQAGADSVVLDADGDVIINDANHKAALDEYIKLVQEGLAPTGASQIDWAAAQNLFNQGSLAMTKFWAHGYTQIPEDSTVYGNVGVTTMPAGPGGSAAIPGAWYLSIPQGAANESLAKDFIQFAYDNNELALDSALGLAATVSALEGADATERPNLTALLEALDSEGTTGRPATADWQEIVDSVLIPMIQKATSGDAVDTQALLDDAAAQIESIVK